MKVTLYTRAGCHLCEEAEAILAAHGLRAEQVDVDRDPELRARYNECVPVVEIDGKERFRGRIDPLLLRRLIANGSVSPGLRPGVTGGAINRPHREEPPGGAGG